jgi:ABC-type branched-subunit amino acid transport system substrate-binding protein
MTGIRAALVPVIGAAVLLAGAAPRAGAGTTAGTGSAAGAEQPGAPAGPDGAGRPHFDPRDRPREYAGPGREDEAPADLDAIRIGWFGPADPDHHAGGDPWLAASLAIEEANAAGGYHGLPYRLLAGWSESPWGTGISDLARLIYDDRVWGILGSIDGASTHLAEQLVAKARLVLINPAGSDVAIHMANVPWVFSLPPADDRQAIVLARALAAAGPSGIDRLTLVSATDHDSRAAADSLGEALGRLRLAPLFRFEVEPGAPSFAGLVERVAESRPEAIAVVAPAIDAARLVAALRRRLPGVRIAGGAALGRRIFIERAGPAAEGAIFPSLCDPASLSGPFARDFTTRFGRRPDCAALLSYDAARLLIAAIEAAGLNRALIRDAVEATSAFAGIGGEVRWNRLGQNEAAAHLATIQGGTAVAVPGP